jgi:hypothetical protein
MLAFGRNQKAIGAPKTLPMMFAWTVIVFVELSYVKLLTRTFL